MEKNNFKPGDVVQLQSGGLKMTIGWIDSDGVSCMCFWVHDHDVKQKSIPIAALRVADRENRSRVL